MKSTNLLTIQHKYTAKTRQTYLILSDLHLDSKFCNKNLLRRHLKQAQERNARVLIFGDTFDAMQGKKDRRAAKNEQTNLNLKQAYFNDILNQNYGFLEPFSDNIYLITYGNHETSIIKHNDIDLLELLTDKLGCNLGGYAGFIRFAFEHEAGGKYKSYDLYWHHGSGGDAPVTKGMIQHYRQSAFIDADIIVSGHNHWQFKYPQIRMGLNHKGNLEKRKQVHIKIGTYKDEITDDPTGFMMENNNAPRPLGGCWLEFYWNGEIINFSSTETED